MQNLAGTINVSNDSGETDLYLDDSEDATGQVVLMSDGQVMGISPATINYTDSGTSSLTVDGGSGGNTFVVNDTFVNPSVPNTPTNIYKGTGTANYVEVNATAAGSVLNIYGNGSGLDYVTLGNDILGIVNIEELDGGVSFLTVDLTNDGTSHDFTLSSANGTTSTLTDTGGYPDVNYQTAAVASLVIDTDPALNQTLNVDFSGGYNPIPYALGSPGLFFNADGDGSSLLAPAGAHTLNISGELNSGAFLSETHNAESPNDQFGPNSYGDIEFNDGAGLSSSLTGLVYTGLSPIVDTAPATNYIFNDYGYPDQSFDATYSTPYLQFASIPTPPTPANFETTDIKNKVNVTFNTPALFGGLPGTAAYGQINIGTKSAGLTTLTFNMVTGNNNTVDIVATPAGVATTLNDSTASDTINVDGTGVAASTNLVLYGGSNPDTLHYDAGGLVPTVTEIGSQIVEVGVPALDGRDVLLQPDQHL